MKKNTLGICIFLIALFAFFGSLEVNSQQVKPVPENFVFAQDTVFYINKPSGIEPYYYAGTNNYYLMYKPMNMVEDILDDMVDLNMKVVRMWFFMDGEKFHDGHRLQSEPGVIYEPTMVHIDNVVVAAAARGIKIVPVFINYWSDFGGMPQYATWAGTSAENFYSNEQAKQIFKNYMAKWINRVNTVTGIAYKDDPTIFAWQLTNEGRSTPQTLTDYVNWASEMSAYIRSLDPYHMISMGDEGLMNYSYAEATENPDITNDWTYTGGQGDYLALLDVPNLDYGTFHNYATDNWSKDLEWGLDWTRHHIKVSHAKNKPCVMEEFNYAIQPPWTVAKDQNRANAIQAYVDLIEDMGMAGNHSWMLIGLNYFDDVEAGYTLDPNAPVENLWLYRVKWGGHGHQYSKYDTYTAPVLRQHGQNMNDKNVLNNPSAFSPISPSNNATSVSANTNFKWEDAAYATSYSLVVATDAALTNVVLQIDNIYNNSKIVSGLGFNTTYYWQVVAHNIRGSKTMTGNVYSYVTQVPPPTVGSFSLTAPKGNNTAISGTQFSWTNAVNAEYYNLIVSENMNYSDPIINVEGIEGRTYTAQVDLKMATTYFWRVTAKNALYEKVAQSQFTTKLQTGLIDDFESYQNATEMQNSWMRNTGGETFTVSPSANLEGGQRMKIDYSFSNNGYCGAQLTKNMNLIGYEGIAFDWFPDGSGHEFTMQLVEGDEYYEANFFIEGTSKERIFINFDLFKQASWNMGTGNGVLDLNNITGAAIYLGGGGGAGTIYIDNLRADFDVPTDIAASKLGSFVTVYPNPAHNYVNISLNERSGNVDLTLELYSITGQRIATKIMNGGVLHLNLSEYNLVSGVYLLKIKQGDTFVVERLVIHNH